MSCLLAPFQQLPRPILIAGPCSAETEAQTFRTAQGLCQGAARPHLFRSGIWKPRTKPGSFEGVGRTGLQWLKEIKQQLRLEPVTEVGTPEHIEQCLAADIRYVWLGARTTVNPFYVSEIARALKGTSLKVLIKNPVNPDIDLWIGAFERIAQAGITDIALIHRGFSSYKPAPYRNKPMWSLALEVKRRLAHIPLLCDPSHIAGKRALIPHLAERASMLGFDGLMIETHPCPDNALTDALQQITPDAYHRLIHTIVWKKIEKKDVRTLDKLREKINQIDDALLDLLAKRMQVVQKIGKVKKRENLAVFQARRWDNAKKRLLQSGIAKDLSQPFLNYLLESIHTESLRLQSKIFHQKNKQ